MTRLTSLGLLKAFFRSTSAAGVLLILCVIIALIIANSGFGGYFEDFLGQQFGAELSGLNFRYPLRSWINDGLMAIFFLLVGLEIKREMIGGELSSIRKASLPILAACGGVLVPALIYFTINARTETAAGWGIPMATDIAFAIAIVSMLGSKVPPSLKIFLSALAIVDDLMAILVIALFYSTDIHLSYLLYAGAILVLLLVFNRMKVRTLVMYLIPGVFVWYFIHHSGVHATIAGVLIALVIPAGSGLAESPLEYLAHKLVNPVNFIIMPLFALANTNIRFEAGMFSGLTSALGLGIVVGLVVGKPVGITLLSWIVVKSGIAKLPTKATWMNIIGVGMLGGIGFTMSIFIALLSFSDYPMILSQAKFAILTASIFSGTLGYFWLSWFAKRKV